MATKKRVMVTVGRKKKISADKITIPDIWCAAMRIRNRVDQDEVLETWALCHQLLKHITGNVTNPSRFNTSAEIVAHNKRLRKAEDAANKRFK